jgi:hypothetical protein
VLVLGVAAESVTRKLRVVLVPPRNAGKVPLRVPFEARLKPCGRGGEPATLHLYGAVPPLAVKVALYGVPSTPGGNDVVVIVTTGGGGVVGVGVGVTGDVKEFPPPPPPQEPSITSAPERVSRARRLFIAHLQIVRGLQIDADSARATAFHIGTKAARICRMPDRCHSG